MASTTLAIDYKYGHTATNCPVTSTATMYGYNSSVVTCQSLFVLRDGSNIRFSSNMISHQSDAGAETMAPLPATNKRMELGFLGLLLSWFSGPFVCGRVPSQRAQFRGSPGKNNKTV